MVEPVGVGPPEHHAEIIAVDPISLAPKFVLNFLKKSRVRQWVGYGHTDIIGTGGANERHRLLDLSPAFAWVSELQEVAGPNAGRSEPFGCSYHVLNLQSLIHRIQDSL